ncbi:alginate O-acetyltransferase AlgF [Endozoicomonas arenosclerae]|uniref:alginate O-acetyltransferase AlgF n=1 Tax=Endozoicomonas arenosclerae TaxID=1633495 RepID=UPI00078420EF|nr:alginate O-acetyltransferase AlgF [Endozoicomonas arenosclerae]
MKTIERQFFSILRAFSAFLTAISLFASGSLWAEVYDPVAAADSAFVRVYSDQPASMKDLLVGGKKPPFNKVSGLTPYILLKEGTHSVQGLPGLDEIELKAKRFYTLLEQGGGYIVKEDEAFNRKSKAMVRLYNVSDMENISLKTADGKVAILEEIAAGLEGSRTINAVNVSLAIYAGEQQVAKVGSIKFKRGEVTNIFFGGQSQRVSVDNNKVYTRL